MILVGQYDSPFARRVAVTLHHYAMPFERDTRSIFGDAAAIQQITPLIRIPALILEDGEVLIDSTAIIDHLDELVGPGALVPRDGPQRRRILQATALAQGIAEKAGAVSYERHFHSAGCISPLWEQRCLGQIAAGLADLESRLVGDWLCGEEMTHADIMATCAIGYIRLRVPHAFPDRHFPGLAALAARCEALPAFTAAAISPDEGMPTR